MPTFEDCANCGELLSENYGAASDDKCVECNSAEQRAKAKTEAAAPPNRRQDEAAPPADPAQAAPRSQLRDGADGR